MSREVQVRFCESRAVQSRPATHHLLGFAGTKAEAEEVDSLAPDAQLHDPGLGRFRAQPEFGQQHGQPRQRGRACPFDRHITNG